MAQQEVAGIIQRVGDLLNAELASEERVWPIDRLATHCTRIGSAHDLDANGIDLTSVMQSGGRNERTLPRYYTREFAAQESGVRE